MKKHFGISPIELLLIIMVIGAIVIGLVYLLTK
jgi:hypothetical protein